MGARENQKRRQQHLAYYFPICKRNNPNNSSSSGNRSDAFAVMLTDISAMMDNEVLYDAHSRSFGAKRVNRLLAQITSH